MRSSVGGPVVSVRTVTINAGDHTIDISGAALDALKALAGEHESLGEALARAIALQKATADEGPTTRHLVIDFSGAALAALRAIAGDNESLGQVLARAIALQKAIADEGPTARVLIESKGKKLRELVLVW